MCFEEVRSRGTGGFAVWLGTEWFGDHAPGVPNLPIILIPAAVVHCLDTASYASRIVGARTGRLALTGALFNIVSLASRVAYTLQAPLLGSAVDRMVREGHTGGMLRDFQLIIVAAIAGTFHGAALPHFQRSSVALRSATRFTVHFPRFWLRSSSSQFESVRPRNIKLFPWQSGLLANTEEPRFGPGCAAPYREFRIRHKVGRYRQPRLQVRGSLDAINLTRVRIPDQNQ